jgi:hypothetical protein
MNAHELLNRHGIPLGAIVSGGTEDEFDWWRGKIILTDRTANGVDARAHLCALHELAHWRQGEERPWLFWMIWLRPVRWWLEMDAWRRAVGMMG